MQEAACPHRIALKKVRNRYLQSFAKRRMLLGDHYEIGSSQHFCTAASPSVGQVSLTET